MIFRKFLYFTSAYFFLLNTCFGQRTNISKIAENKIDALFADYNNSKSPGYAIGIFKNQQILVAKGYGMANLDYNIPISENTVFNIASLSKQFTAACIAELILRDSISLEDTVSRFIPEIAKFNYPIKIKHLIYFTSGIPEYHTLPHKNGLNWNLYDYFTIDIAIATSLSQPNLEFTPETKWAYSNTNFMLLAKIIENVTHKTLNEFATEVLFKPLGMKSSQVNDDVTVVIKNRAIGYIPRTEEVVNAAKKDGYYLRKEGSYLQTHRNAPHYGGSGVLTSINDWYLWDKNFYTQLIGGKPFYDLMHKRMKFSYEKDNDAFGLVFGKYEGEDMIWYAGGDIGFNSYVMRFPKQQITIVCFSNLGLGGNAEKMAMKVADILVESKILLISK